MKKLFESPNCIVEEICVEDIITTSIIKPGENELPGGGGL